VRTGTCGPFTLRVDDFGGQSATQADFRILVLPAPTGRNDSVATAYDLGTTNGNILIASSISPYSDPSTSGPDTDYYKLTATAGTTTTPTIVTVEVFARRLVPESKLDSVIEIVNNSGARFTTCRDFGSVSGVNGAPDPTPTLFDDPCLNDDIILGTIRDSKLEFQVPGTPGQQVEFLVRVLDWRGDARPDFRYQMRITGAN